jgi:hypothetical protein
LSKFGLIIPSVFTLPGPHIEGRVPILEYVVAQWCTDIDVDLDDVDLPPDD